MRKKEGKDDAMLSLIESDTSPTTFRKNSPVKSTGLPQ
jgi:hypothetical protein